MSLVTYFQNNESYTSFLFSRIRKSHRVSREGATELRAIGVIFELHDGVEPGNNQRVKRGFRCTGSDADVM